VQKYRDILQQVADGKPNRHIADQICLSTHTVKNHKANLKKKLGLKSTLSLFKYALDWVKQKTSPNDSEAKEKETERGGGGKLLIVSIL
jgi:DNA-binding CsgD family transcriptional regulator